MSLFSKILFHTKGNFLRSVITIAIPITLQSIMFSSRGLVDLLMIGKLGEVEIATIGVAARATFITTVVLIGVTTGGSLLTAQYWGAGDENGVRESTALTWLVSMLFAALIATFFILFPNQVMLLTTSSEKVKALGSQYLSVTAVNMFAIACIASMSVGLRTIHQPSISTFFSGIGILSNIFLNWIFILGNFGVQPMGVEGAAIATVFSGIIEVLTLYGYLYAKKHLLAFRVYDITQAIEWKKIIRFLKLSLPTTFNFFVWAAGLFAYHAIMGRSSIQGLIALSVMIPIESISLTLLIGMSNAAAVLVGNQLGAKNYDVIYYQALGLTALNLMLGIIVSITLYLLHIPILNLFSALTTETRALAEKFIIILSLGIVLRSIPMIVIIGILRAGGDVKFCLYQDLIVQWLVSIPLSAFSATVLNLPPEWIYLLFLTEEIIKWTGSLHRMKSKRWMQNLIEN
ncbi:multidrug resistance protein [Candidatus Photodesmus blepharus]|uniref:Multidrug resistance protein NorM n=1 Tax=Candidatus Photodesmus blepharonis TaxID=1179155 RepID=A0A084CMR1_9GAMM|nr:MATE family efflux transporter [Candidatus Photodesmus blepharus]KEY91090.1 multidrug resistance protein [Candidatus Photodesmus blepharus]